MKALLNVDGEKLAVHNIGFRDDKVTSVTVMSGERSITYYDLSCPWIPEGSKVLYLDELLEFPTIEQAVADKWKKLIEHLEEVIVDEDSMLTHLAISAMDEEPLPFEGLNLVEKQKEFKLMQQRVLGVIDTVEEVKAFMEGWYHDDDTTTAVEA